MTFAFVGVVLTAADRFDAALRLCDDAISDARERGSVFAFAVAAWLRGHVAYFRGSLGDAEADLRHSIEAGESHGLATGLPHPLARLAHVLMERGDLDAAAEMLARAGIPEEVPDTAHLHPFLESRARLRLLQGRTREGLADLRELGRSYESVDGRNPAIIAWRSHAALALRTVGDEETARRLAREEVELAREWSAPRALGQSLRVAGLVEGGAGGLEMLREAVHVLAESPALLERARALADLGAALRRAGSRAEARDVLRQALDLATQCGATALAERAHGDLVAAGARPRRIATTGVESLTASERRIAEMAASGMTNREIAQALFVTPKTVEMHLHHAFRKLGISSRALLSGALVERAEVDAETSLTAAPDTRPVTGN